MPARNCLLLKAPPQMLQLHCTGTITLEARFGCQTLDSSLLQLGQVMGAASGSC